MPGKKQRSKVLVIGSGPIVIGQAAEFDYAGTQACLTLKEEGHEVILINNNPATSMTDEDVADRVYFEPLTAKSVIEIIEKERPDALLATVSGQTGLNLAFSLHEKGVLDRYNIDVLGTPIKSIAQGEDRDQFRSLMNEINEPISDSAIVSNTEEALSFSKQVGFPIIVRPAYTLGGSGGGIAKDEETFLSYVRRGLRASPIGQCLIETSIAGWKEIEFEVIRDQNDNVITVCHMENIDPVGVHTGDSIVVAPIQTLNDGEINQLKQASLSIVRHLGIIGACNVQLAYEPETQKYIVIEVNPRVSRSSALASKATGYPIAKIATKLSLGYTLDEITFAKKKETLATYEPVFDYVVVKFPCWPFDKLTTADRQLGTQMKATGETMAVDKTITASLQKAVRSLEREVDGLTIQSIKEKTTTELNELIVHVDDRRFFALLELMRRGAEVEQLANVTKIAPFFLEAMQELVSLELQINETNLEHVTKDELLTYKQAGFSDVYLAKAWKCSTSAIKKRREKFSLFPSYETIDAFSEKEDDEAVYYYSTWSETDNREKEKSEKEAILIIGSGPIQIGQGVEFDYCSVQGIHALKRNGYRTVLINNNPATVSTDYEVADTLYVEPLTAEDVLNVMEHEQITKAIVQFGGQTSINLVKELEKAGVELLGTTMDTIDRLEDRDRFYTYLQSINVPHIPGKTAVSTTDLYEKAEEIEYPVLIRPSYVIGGKGMAIIKDKTELTNYINEHITDSSYPILIDAYLPGKEVEVDVVTDGKTILVPAIFEHVEKAGVHSGDSMAITPPVSLSESLKEQIVDYTERVATNIHFKGIFNIQFVIHDDTLYVLEVNPRASRTVPVISKITGLNMIDLATQLLLGHSLKSMYGKRKTLPENDFYTVKAPVFSFDKLPGVDPILVPEMKSTGEIIALSKTVEGGFRKAFLWNDSLRSLFERTKREMFVMDMEETSVSAIKDLLEERNINVEYALQSEDITKETLDSWLRSDKAVALFSSGESSIVRERALEFQLIVMTAKETLNAFAQIATEDMPVLAVQHIQKASQKEVVLQ